MPFYDLTCPSAHTQRDVYLPVGVRPPCAECGQPTSTLWDTPCAVIGDECDVTIRHGLCHDDGSPRRYRSRSEIRREAQARGMTNYVEHVPARESDKSPHTTRWV